ncbi:MAG: serine/threonine-protein kinase [Myxococcaceae bacterium]|nr:serine/threonine-protein kinase [Myxococcaceae bacterium]
MADPIDQLNANALLGQVVDGRYKVESVLGQGGMGVVFRAVQTSVQRPVAMKTLHPQLAMAPTFFERFRREAEIASRLHHPNIITIFDFGRTSDGLCYYVMEMLQGESLRQRVKRDGPMTLRQASAVIEQIALGVGHAHKQGVIHRDLKPHNVMLSLIDGNEYVKVLDFGLVKAMEQEDEEQLTSTGQVLGTPQYMPPEQAGGEKVDQRGDLYSLTGVFYYCLTGHSPFGANTVRKALQASLTQKPALIATHRKGAPVPDAIDRFCQKGLEPEQDDRFQSAEAFIEALHAALAGASDTVLDATPEHVADAAKESGSGSSSASRRSGGSSRTGSRNAVKSVASVNKPKGSSASKLEPPPARPAEPVQPNAGVPLGLVAGIAAALVLVIVVAIAIKSMKTPAPPVPAPPIARPTPPAPALTPAPAAPGATTVTVSLATTPPGAEVLEGGVTVGTTPLSVSWPRGEKRTYTFSLAGHQRLEKTLKPEADEDFTFALEPLRKPTSPTPRPPSVKAPPKPPGDDVSAFE